MESLFVGLAIVLTGVAAGFSLLVVRDWRAEGRRPNGRWTHSHSILLLAWCFSVIPAAVQVWQVGRPATFSLLTVAPQTRAAGATATALTGLIALYALLALASRLRAHTPNLVRLAAFLLPWGGTTVLSGLLAEATLGRQILLYP